jgi:cell division protein ZapA
MSSNMKQMEVTIMGQSYILGCPEGGEVSLLEAVSSVDREMSAIRDGGRVKARERIAVLAALNLAYALAERPAIAPPAAASSSSAGATSGNGSEIDLDALIQRLDQALGADGQLL